MLISESEVGLLPERCRDVTDVDLEKTDRCAVHRKDEMRVD